MFKDDYKSCFDKITGDEKLLEEILLKADKAADKRIQLKRVYRYTASLAAAFVVVLSSAFLYNNGTLKADIKSNNSDAVSTKEETSVLPDEIIVSETEESSTEDKKQSIANNTKQEKHIQPKTETSKEETAPAVSDNTGKSNLNDGIMTASLYPEDAAIEENISPAYGDESTGLARSIMNDAESYDFEPALTVFKEGILSSPEITYNNAGDKTIIYTDDKKEKRIEFTLSQSGIKVHEDSVIIDADGVYIELFTEGISEEYKAEIISSFVDK